jgi:hypothetical protein
MSRPQLGKRYQKMVLEMILMSHAKHQDWAVACS